MKPLSLEPHFITRATAAPAGKKAAAGSGSSSSSSSKRQPSVAELVKSIKAMPFVEAADLLRNLAYTLVERDEAALALNTFRELDSALAPEGEDLPEALRNLHALALQIITSLYIETEQQDEALLTAAGLLNTMALEPRRKDEPFLAILASLLYDIAYIHSERGHFKQAERELEKSMKLFERLAKSSPERYGSAHIMALNASTNVYRSRVKQVNLLAHNQVATSTYLEMLNAGIEGAADRLIDSLTSEGRTLAQMGRYREAVQYFSRALKYLTKIEPEFTLRQLQLSIDLGEALLNVNVSRDKGIHLLNTMLHKATKLNADEEHRRIVDILLNAKSRRLDILSIWHKVFPR